MRPVRVPANWHVTNVSKRKVVHGVCNQTTVTSHDVSSQPTTNRSTIVRKSTHGIPTMSNVWSSSKNWPGVALRRVVAVANRWPVVRMKHRAAKDAITAAVQPMKVTTEKHRAVLVTAIGNLEFTLHMVAIRRVAESFKFIHNESISNCASVCITFKFIFGRGWRIFAIKFHLSFLLFFRSRTPTQLQIFTSRRLSGWSLLFDGLVQIHGRWQGKTITIGWFAVGNHAKYYVELPIGLRIICR